SRARSPLRRRRERRAAVCRGKFRASHTLSPPLRRRISGNKRRRGGSVRSQARRQMTSDLEGFERFGREQLLRRETPRRQPLFVVIAQEGVEHVAIGGETVRPPI